MTTLADITSKSKRPLPKGWQWVRMKDVVQLNPRRPADLQRADDAPTSFVPMEAVDEVTGAIAKRITRPFGEIKQGYTYFAEGDVLFAKITPCMQNGKHAIARELTDGIGLGTTEFHVLRPGPTVIAEWIHYFVRQPGLLLEATEHFTGAVGQQRLPADYLANLSLPLPPLDEQRRIATILNQQMAAVERARRAAEDQKKAAQCLPMSFLRGVFSKPTDKRPRIAKLGDVLRLRKEVVHPRDNPHGPAAFVGLEHIESGTGRRLGSDDVEMSELTGRKPRFYKGDLVYGYLRPYLNKVWIAEFDGLCSVDQYVYEVNPDAAYRLMWHGTCVVRFIWRIPLSGRRRAGFLAFGRTR